MHTVAQDCSLSTQEMGQEDQVRVILSYTASLRPSQGYVRP